jgi:hypothetical protein
MSYLAALLIVVASAAAAAVASRIVNRFVPIDVRRKSSDEGARVFTQLGTMFALLLAFVFSQVWAEHRTAAQAINGEVAALRGASALADALPNHAGRPVNLAIIAYARTVVGEEWRTMATRRSSSDAALEDFRIVIEQTARLDPVSRSDGAIQSQMLSQLALAKSYRETRIYQVGQGLEPALWFVLDVLAISLIALVLLAPTEGFGHFLFASIFTATTVMVLVLVALLDFPFEGAVSLAPTDFVKLLADTSRMVAAE